MSTGKLDEDDIRFIEGMIERAFKQHIKEFESESFTGTRHEHKSTHKDYNERDENVKKQKDRIVNIIVSAVIGSALVFTGSALLNETRDKIVHGVKP